MMAAMAHKAVAAARSPGTCCGRLAAATATIPVPITEAYQLGVMFEMTCRGCSRSRSNPHRAKAWVEMLVMSSTLTPELVTG
jgi:hypothetical protein